MSVESKKADDFCLCPKFEKTFGILGKKWNGLILEVLLAEGDQRFTDLAQKIPQCSDRVLVERLKELEKDGLIEKVYMRDCARGFYRLTRCGEDLKRYTHGPKSGFWKRTRIKALTELKNKIKLESMKNERR